VRRGAGEGAPARVVRTVLKSLCYLACCENNSKLLQIADGWQGGQQAVSMACGEIPCAAGQGNEFAGTAK